MTQPIAYGTEGSRNYSLYYKHSNRVPLLGLLLGGLAGIVAGLLAATIYAYAISYIPFIYVRALLGMLFGIALGAVPASLMRWGKVRNVPVVLTVAAVVTAIAYCFHWLVWVYILFNRGPVEITFTTLLINPSAVLKVIEQVYETGTWGYSRPNSYLPNPPAIEMVKGIELGLYWLAEFLVISLFAIVIAKKSQAEAPYCESCDAWCPAGVEIRKLGLSDQKQLRANLEAKNWGLIARIGPPTPGAIKWQAIIHHGCPTCGKFQTLTATSFEKTTDRNGKPKTKERIFVDKLFVTKEDVEAVRSMPI